MTDARYIAWLASEDRLRVASEISRDKEGKVRTPLPEYYWALLLEAKVFADLARVGAETGFIVGDELERRETEKIQRQKHIDEVFAKASDDDDILSVDEIRNMEREDDES